MKPYVKFNAKLTGLKKDEDPPLREWEEERTFYPAGPNDAYLIAERVAENGWSILDYGNIPPTQEWAMFKQVCEMGKVKIAKPTKKARIAE